VDSAGNTYITDPANNRLVKFDPSGKFLFNITGDGTRKLTQPSRVAVDSTGSVYTNSIGGLNSQTIWKFDSTGAFIGEWFNPYDADLVINGKDELFEVGPEIIGLGLPSS
jgi:hypothetical protein